MGASPPPLLLILRCYCTALLLLLLLRCYCTAPLLRCCYYAATALLRYCSYCTALLLSYCYCTTALMLVALLYYCVSHCLLACCTACLLVTLLSPFCLLVSYSISLSFLLFFYHLSLALPCSHDVPLVPLHLRRIIHLSIHHLRSHCLQPHHTYTTLFPTTLPHRPMEGFKE